MTSLEQFFDACTLNYVNYFHRVPVAWWKSVHELHTVDDLGYAWRASPDGDGALMEEVSEYCRGDLEGEGQFPGPQCMPLRRLDTSTVCDPSSSYTFTEKSDGLRMIWMFRESSSFPVWKGLQELMGDDTADEQRNINDIMELEWGRYQLAATTGAPHVTITVMGRQLSMMSTDKSSAENAFRIRVEEGNTEVVLERTLGPRVLGYCFDRSLDAVHVALEVAPLACSFVSAVLDGELLVATKDSAEHLLFGAFDLLSTQRRSEQLQWYSRDSLSTRYAHLQMLLPTTSIKSNVFGVMWFVKEMFPLSCDGMTQCLDKLELSESDGSLWFERLGGFRSKNDGLVFSPNNFPIQRGSCASQFKWKWQQHLSVDFLLAPPKDAKTSGVVSYHASLFFLKRSLTFDGKKGLATHWPLIRPVRLANPHCLTLQQSQVVECTFDATQRCWSMEKLRPDKVSANSIRTAISVYEALAENVSLPRLLALLGVSDAATDAHATRLTGVTHNAITAPLVKPILDKRRASVKLMLRVVKNANSSVLRLQWCTNTKHPERPRSIVSSLCDVSQCFGLSFGPAAGADGTSSLVDLLSIELANNGGSYAWSDFTVEACFRPDVGRWEIMDLTQNDGAKNSATFDGVLSHLEYILDGQQPKVASTRPPFGVPSRKLGKLLTTSLDETKFTNAHYAEKTALLSDDVRSSRSNLRNFNNILKSWLISTSITRVCEEVKIKSSDLRILDLCCGRGGDLHKWKAVSPAFVLMIDSSMESVAEAARRYSSQGGMSTKVLRSDTRGFPARFCVEDVFDRNGSFKDNLHKMTVNAALHVVSCQFSIHYGFASTERVHFVMDAISAALAPGGLFIGTTVSDEALMERAKKEGKDFGNAAYRVSFASSSDVETMVHSGRASFGVKYYATVQHSVSDLAEYVVPWSEFVQICSARKLTLVSDELFQGVYDRNVATDEWQSITNVIVGRKRSRGGGAAAAQIDLSEDEWEAARLYRAFVFQKAL